MRTMSKIDLRSYVFSGKEQLFFDTNIWLFLYGPSIGYNPRRVNQYADAWKKVRLAKAAVYIDVLVISEFINTYSRLEYNQLPNAAQRYPSFKVFRKSPDFSPIAADIATQTRRILAYVRQCDSSFSDSDIHTLINEYAHGSSDYNDLVIAETCKKNGLTLVTDDADFARPASSGLAVITANPRLLTI